LANQLLADEQGASLAEQIRQGIGEG